MAATASPPASAVGGFTAEAFARALEAQAGLPAWWIERKKAAYDQFAALPLPRRTDEAWRFSAIGGINLQGLAPAEAPSETFASTAAAETEGRLSGASQPIFALTIANGIAHAAGPMDELTRKGVIFTTLREALRSHPALVREHFMAQPQKLGSEKFAALHTAFVGDGAFIHVPRGVEVPTPLLVLHQGFGDGAAFFPHTLVVAGDQAKVTVVDQFLSGGPGAQFACGANDLYAGHGAQLTYIGVQNWSPETLSFQLNSTVVRRDARVQSLNIHLGARQARHESLSQLQAPGAFSEMLALTVASGAQEFDQRTLQVHQAPNTKSDLLYKNALLDKARTIFSGLIIVDPDAQKTDAYQSNRNLMLSDDAEANSLPGLEIQANDVRCTHGATSGRIDPEQEFYLRARGIAPERAHELIVFGFFEEVLNRLENDALRALLRGLIEAKFRR